MTPEQREARNMKTTVKSLVNVIEQAVDGLDRVGKQPSTFDRGKALAAIANYLEMAKDQAKHFALGKSLKPRKRRSKQAGEYLAGTEPGASAAGEYSTTAESGRSPPNNPDDDELSPCEKLGVKLGLRDPL